MAVSLVNNQGANFISAPVRAITVYDNLSGCPPTRTNPLLTTTFTISRPAFLRITSTMIRSFNGRDDHYIAISGPTGSNYAGGQTLSVRLNYTSGGTWDNVVNDAEAYCNMAGTYSVWTSGATPSSWGCGRYWGNLCILIMEV